MTKFSPSPNFPVETILFAHNKIKPSAQFDQSTDTDKYVGMLGKTVQNEARQAINTHLLETTKPNLLLQKIFQPYLILVKLLGCQPLKIHPNGCATFAYFSWNVAYSISVFGVFIFDTTYFFPIMKSMNSELNQNPLVYFTEILLVLSQIFAALISYIFMAIQAQKLANLWNRLQEVLVKLVARCPNHLDLVPSYRSARMKITVWLMFTIVFGACYITSFHDEIRTYLNEQRYNSVMYWTMFSGFAVYSVMLSMHILHSTCFTTFICVLASCFKTLGNIALKQDGQGTMRNSQSPILFHEVTEIYEELNKLKTLLGRIYGVYIGLEILAMIICVTINLFFMISKPGFSSLFVLNVAIAMPYLIWFHGVCNCCGELDCRVRRTIEELKVCTKLNVCMCIN